jgi:hypothetical protein
MSGVIRVNQWTNQQRPGTQGTGGRMRIASSNAGINPYDQNYFAATEAPTSFEGASTNQYRSAVRKLKTRK